MSYGLLSSIDNNEIKHICSTENGSSGSPILNLETNKVIGIHKEGSIHFEFNKGTYLKYPLIDFIQKNKNKIVINQNSNFNIISNMNKQNNNVNYNNATNNNNQINNFINWNSSYKIDKFENLNNFPINSIEQMINVFFISPSGSRNCLVLNRKTATVDEMLTRYLKIKNITELYGKNDEISFLYNGNKLRFGDLTLISTKLEENACIQVITTRLCNINFD